MRESSRTPQGVRGLKLMELASYLGNGSRTPQGVRGLKRYRKGSEAPASTVALRKECVD